jgi:hypothetical protein
VFITVTERLFPFSALDSYRHVYHSLTGSSRLNRREFYFYLLSGASGLIGIVLTTVDGIGL